MCIDPGLAPDNKRFLPSPLLNPRPILPIVPSVSTLSITDIETERHKLRVALDELAVAQRVYAGNPIMLGMIKGRTEKIRDRLYDLDRLERAAKAG